VNLVKAGAVFDLLGRIQQESYKWRGMDASAAKILASGWADPGGGGDDTGFRRSLGNSTGWNFQFTPDGVSSAVENRRLSAAGGGIFPRAWDVDGHRRGRGEHPPADRG